MAFAYREMRSTVEEEESVDPHFREKLRDRLVGKVRELCCLTFCVYVCNSLYGYLSTWKGIG